MTNVLDGLQKWTLKKGPKAYDGGFRYGLMTTNIIECINGVLKGARMLPITALVEVTFYRCVTYFEKRCAEIRARIANRDMYTIYAMTKVTNYEIKASEYSISNFNRENEMFDVTTTAHGFHMDKGKKISKLLISKRTNVVAISGNHLASLVHTCLLFVFMQGLIVGNMLTDTLLWMHMQDVMLHNFFPFHINHIDRSQTSLFFIQIQHFYERKGYLDHQG